MITYQVETWEDYHRDSEKLWQEDFNEVFAEKWMELAPDIEKYKMLEQFDMLLITTARNDGELVGFHISIISPHMHCRKTNCAFQDALYLSKGFRKGFVGIKLLKFTEIVLQMRGVEMLYFTSPETRDSGKLFEYLGFKKSDTVYSKYIGK